MNIEEMVADLAQYFKEYGFKSVQVPQNSDHGKVYVEWFDVCRLQLEPKPRQKKIRICAYAEDSREMVREVYDKELKEIYAKKGLQTRGARNRRADGRAGVVFDLVVEVSTTCDDWKSFVLSTYKTVRQPIADKPSANKIREEFKLWAVNQKDLAMRREECPWDVVERGLNDGRKAFEKHVRLNLNEMIKDLEGEFQRRSWIRRTPTGDGQGEQTNERVLCAYKSLFNHFWKEFEEGRVNFSPSQRSGLKHELDVLKASESMFEMLKKAEHKGYELYVIVGIWHLLCKQLSDFNNSPRREGMPPIWLEPRTQYSVPRHDGSGSRYLIDLYFPDINYAIECDEAQHKIEENVIRDMHRERDLVQALGCKVERVDATRSFVAINNDISNIVEDIMRIVRNKAEKERFVGWLPSYKNKKIGAAKRGG